MSGIDGRHLKAEMSLLVVLHEASMSNFSLTTATLASAVLFTYILLRLISSRREPLPPGPRRWPLIGSALEVPRSYPWLTYTRWAKKYGNLVYADVAGQPLVVINSAKIAKDLLDQRSAIYSERPTLVMAKLSGYCEGFVLQPYGENWRQQRKIVSQEFSQLSITRHYALQENEAKKLIRALVDDPKSLRRELKLRLGTIIIQVTFGHYLTGHDDPFLTMPLTAVENFSKATAAGAWVVDFVPMLQYLPKWMPGAGFLTTAANYRKIVFDTTYEPYLWSKKNLAAGTINLPNMCSTVLEQNPSAEGEDPLVWAASSVMGGGLDTNTSTVSVFFHAIMGHPAIQAKARQEIHDVIGRDRLPTIRDKASLPYVRSVMAEVLRLHPAIPAGIPHALRKDDIYEGMHLPKGSLMIPNVWYMLHDPEVYPDPDIFNPDRYNNLDSEMKKVWDVAFGFGRRICPGMLFAEGTFFAIAATVLATCEIIPTVDSKGNNIVPNLTPTSGAISFPSDFDINLKCLSKEAFDLLSSGLGDELKY
ncbi:putative monooxygenase [Mycena polygramma]|nr:putative monooxygenase [Mycena polygramma]